MSERGSGRDSPSSAAGLRDHGPSSDAVPNLGELSARPIGDTLVADGSGWFRSEPESTAEATPSRWPDSSVMWSTTLAPPLTSPARPGGTQPAPVEPQSTAPRRAPTGPAPAPRQPAIPPPAPVSAKEPDRDLPSEAAPSVRPEDPVPERRLGAPPTAEALASADPATAPRPPAARQRIFRIFLGARAAVGTAVALGQALIGALFGAWSLPMLGIGIAYAVSAVAVWAWGPAVAPRPTGTPWGLPRWLLAATVGVDIAAFAGLLALSPVGGPNYGALLVMPVLMAGVFMPRRSGFAVAAMLTLGLLLASALGSGGGMDLAASLAQAGLAGSGLFVVVLLATELSARLEREERSARGSLERARQEAQLNRLVIDEMRDGVMVVDRAGWVRRANPAARALIAAAGAGPQPPFQLRHVPAWVDLVSMIDTAFRQGQLTDSALDATLSFEAGHRRILRVRPRFTRQQSGREREDLCVLFLEDLRDVQARSRQEKLAAMGRVSAGIAHEIRNPLSAIAQANALLAEDAQDAAQQRLSRMVAENVERLKRIVDDVLEAAPAAASDCEPIDATALVAAVVQDWAQTARVRVAFDGVVQLEVPQRALGVHFDADHLRRVLVNLLENAHRHATGKTGGIRVRLYESGPVDAALLVVNDGEAISPDVERHLFEPFFSTRSRGSGLGLYICRELCERYGARIDYRQRGGPDGPRNEFHVVMRRRELAAQPTLPAALTG